MRSETSLEYTRLTRRWLDQRYRRTDDRRVYYAHQPIYGFRGGPSEPGVVEKYMRTYAIMRALSTLRFSSLLDVGGAEGYKAHVAQRLFGVRPYVCDLSTEAARRTGEIFGIPAISCDIHSLPFADGAVDVVLCSETLEHVADYDRALHELLRVARVAVVITVPHEEEGHVGEEHEQEVHSHIHRFDVHSFDSLAARGCTVAVEKVVSRALLYPGVLLEARRREHPGWQGARRRALVAYNAMAPALERAVPRSLARRLVSGLVRMDAAAAGRLPGYDAVLATIVKDGSKGLLPTPSRRVRPSDIVDIGVPLHRLPD